VQHSQGQTAEVGSAHEAAACELCGTLGSFRFGTLHHYLAVGPAGVERHTACDDCASEAEDRGWIREAPELSEWTDELALPEPPPDAGGNGASAASPVERRMVRSCAICARVDEDISHYLAVAGGAVERRDVCSRCRDRAAGLGWMPEAPQLAMEASRFDVATVPAISIPPPRVRPVRLRRRVLAPVARMLGSILLTTGVLGLADVAITLTWQEPITAISASIEQGKLSEEVDVLEATARAELGEVNQAKPVAEVAAKMRDGLETGDAIGRISIDEIGIDFALVEDAGEDASLAKGPSRYTNTHLPGEGQTMGIAGHRTTYSAPFNDIDALDKGDEIVIDMPYGEFTYAVQQTEIVDPEDVGVLDTGRREKIVLTACHPLYSAAQRIVVTGILEDAESDRPGVAV
jgi:sortase A